MNLKLKIKKLLIIIVTMAISAGSSMAQEKEGKKDEITSRFKKYEDVIPDTAITKSGVFTTHKVGDKLYYEISTCQLDKEYLWITQYSKTQTSFGYGGTEVIRRVVRWELFQDNILLRNVEYDLRADEGSPEEIAVKASSVDEIIKAFKVITFGKDRSPVIEVTDLFRNDIHEFSPKQSLNASAIDQSRTFISSVKSFEKNLETRVLATYKLKPATPSNGQRRSSRHSDPSLGSVTVELHHSMIELPDRPMQPRLFDKRVGFFAGMHQDFSSDRHQVEQVRYVRRWRLEKKNPELEVSEPVKPIVFYVGRGIPQKWQQYIREGIEMWQPAFEAAGFKNAIIGKIAPTEEDDPDFDAEDVRYSTIRWLPSTIANAYGPHVQDPRTGEILEADIRVYHNVLSLIRDWYFIQASPNDPRAQQLPLPDEVMGAALRYVVAHEVGHSLGLRHNFKATSYYNVEKYRDPVFTAKYGLEASIMDYGRFNYIAQPGDGAASLTVIGPYDYFAIDWGYREFPHTSTAEEDVPFLNRIAERQLTEPMVRFGGGRENGAVGMADPHARSEDLGDDPVKATTYGLKNLEYVSTYLVKACGEEDKDYTMLDHMYDVLLNQMSMELNHVSALIAGIEIDNLVYGQEGNVYTPTPVEEQKRAVEFILEEAFHTPDYLLNKDIVSRIGMHNITGKISGMQNRVLESMLNRQTAGRMLDLEATGYNSYGLVNLSEDLKEGIFEELINGNEPDVFRRSLQRKFVEQMLSFAAGEKSTNDDLQAVSRGILISLSKDIEKGIRKAQGDITKYHLADLQNMISDGLKTREL